MEKFGIVLGSLLLMGRAWSNKWNYYDWLAFVSIIVSFVLYLWERWG